jgi:hypothetical protein
MPKLPSKPTAGGRRGLARLEFAFTLILIAVLATVLLTRLAELGQAARRQRLMSTMVSVQAASTLFHVLCEARRSTAGSDCASLNIAGTPVQGINGWPAASSEGIGRSLSLPAGPALPGAQLHLQAASQRGRPVLLIALGNAQCEFSYAQAMSPGDSPEVDIVDASCL